jgi:hypothetical protein
VLGSIPSVSMFFSDRNLPASMSTSPAKLINLGSSSDLPSTYVFIELA